MPEMERADMSRMLEALKQIEGRSPWVPPAVKPRPSPRPAEEREPADGPVAREKPVDPPRGDLQSYRDLARNILSRMPSEGSAALMFTSPGDGEGKTSTVVCLAGVLAGQAADEVLVVDANFRRPELAIHFASRADLGLVDVLTGRADWREVVCHTGVQHLSVLPGGRFPTHDGQPPKRLDLTPVLDELRRHHRLVILDTASARWCEGTYLVVRLGQTPRRAVRQAVRVVEACGGRVLGCVLTDVTAGG